MEPWIIATAGFGAGAVGLIWYAARSLSAISRPTSGPSIDPTTRPGRALVLIDLQPDFTRRTGKGAYSQADRARTIAHVNALAAEARQLGEPVIVLRHVWQGWPARLAARLALGGAGNPGRKGLALDPDIQTGEAIDIVKHLGDGFSAAELSAHLERLKVGSLRLAGLDACHCVQLTARGAAARGYKVEILDEAVLAAVPADWQALQPKLIAEGIRISAAPVA
ncbi:MAG: cysteine hydrolase family protein [Pannonibacter sp.]